MPNGFHAEPSDQNMYEYLSGTEAKIKLQKLDYKIKEFQLCFNITHIEVEE